MVITFTRQNTKILLLLFFFFLTLSGNAQVGIGTVTPNASSVLDISSTTQGMLAPRMTTAQRIAIPAPADGLLVYDTNLKSFYYYSTTVWAALNSSQTSRLNFKRIKSTDNLAVVLATELAAGGGAKYVLTSNTLYEINGMVTFNFPIDLNNAYIQGLDANEDIMYRTSGILFDGTTGGSIRSVTILAPGATVFNLNAALATATFLLRDTIIANAASIGTVSGYGLVFLSIVNFSGNTNGITYNNIGQLLLSNQAWFVNNAGTYEKFTGNFTLIEKQGGFSNVGPGAYGLDVATAGLAISGDAVLESVVFTGTTPANYVKPYAAAATYTGYNFSNAWTVRAAGIPNEADTNATGDFSMDAETGGAIPLNLSTSTPSANLRIYSASIPTVSGNLFRFSTDATYNRLKYVGKKKRIFQVSGAVNFQVPSAGTYIVHLYKNGVAMPQFKFYGRGNAASDIVTLPINASIELNTGDYIDFYLQRYSGNDGADVLVSNMTIIIK
ncbi:hypothetical protein [Flavobacterium sp. CLA17]|uniref:hypothetical protein n=1 Tax=Flavobacterium sp. CLA17 TaxID=2724135 RepID=UPI00149288EC|nr:hypothetical protein [Flavobacterium sp. CLA17]QSB29113.1 hypothetical protein HAV12_010350 [Flavobacterium sp. CLA17]